MYPVSVWPLGIETAGPSCWCKRKTWMTETVWSEKDSQLSIQPHGCVQREMRMTSKNCAGRSQSPPDVTTANTSFYKGNLGSSALALLLHPPPWVLMTDENEYWGVLMRLKISPDPPWPSTSTDTINHKTLVSSLMSLRTSVPPCTRF